MKVGDLVKVKDSIMHQAGYGIVIALHWDYDINMVRVLLFGDTMVFPFYKNELEVINEKRN